VKQQVHISDLLMRLMDEAPKNTRRSRLAEKRASVFFSFWLSPFSFRDSASSSAGVLENLLGGSLHVPLAERLNHAAPELSQRQALPVSELMRSGRVAL
jgi:hypothetical protein